MEDLCSPRDDEGYRFNVGVVDRLESTHNLVFMHVDTALREEGNTTLRVSGLVLREILEFVVLVLEVTDVAVAAVYQYSCPIIFNT